MSRRVRLWVAAVLIAVLALPAAPVLARHGQGEGCCAALAVSMATDCEAHGGSRDRTAPAACDGDDGGQTTQSSTLCPHCMAAASIAGVAFGAPAVYALLEATTFVAPPEVSSFIPVVPVDRLERPPKLRSL